MKARKSRINLKWYGDDKNSDQQQRITGILKEHRIW
jgi:hypothetical protein